MGFPGGSGWRIYLSVKETDTPGLGRSPAEGNGNPLQYSCLGNPTDRGAWWATVHGVAKKVGLNLETKQQQNKLILLPLSGQLL